MRRLRTLLVLLACSIATSSVCGASSLVYESRTVEPSATGVQVGAYLENDVTLKAVQMSFTIRSVTGGAYMAGNFSYAATNRFASYWDLTADVFWPGTDGGACPFSTQGPFDYISPDAFVYGATQLFSPDLPPGTDGAPPSGTPSLTLTFDVASAIGTFEIDTSCALLTYFQDPTGGIMPFTFSKGIVTVAEPICNDLPCDVDCDGFCTSLDLALIIDMLFAGHPIAPCCVDK